MPSPDPAGILSEINRIWQDAAPEAIADLVAPYFTEDAVVVAPNLVRVAKGCASVAASYGDFARTTKILELRVEEPQVHFCGNVAVATMRGRCATNSTVVRAPRADTIRMCLRLETNTGASAGGQWHLSRSTKGLGTSPRRRRSGDRASSFAAEGAARRDNALRTADRSTARRRFGLPAWH